MGGGREVCTVYGKKLGEKKQKWREESELLLLLISLKSHLIYSNQTTQCCGPGDSSLYRTSNIKIRICFSYYDL
jgi:hypothetical protein